MNLLKQVLVGLFSVWILWLIVNSAWEKRSQLGFVFKTYFRSGILSYFRAFLNIVAMLTTVIFLYIYSPDFLKWGWGSFVFGSSGNIILQPINTINEASQKANEVFETETPVPLPTITSSPNNSAPKDATSPANPSPNNSVQKDATSPANPTPNLKTTKKSPIDFRWLFLPPLWLIFMVAVPFWAQAEEKMFRQGVHSWKGMIINSIKFGLVHLIMGIPIYIALALSVPGFLFACRYKYAYDKHFKRFRNEIQAQEAGVFASTADHAIYNAILITFLFALLLGGL